jgi:membrane-associated phospholipid phosphatase
MWQTEDWGGVMNQESRLLRHIKTIYIPERLTWLLLACAVAVPIGVLTSTAATGRLSWGDGAWVDFMLAHRWIVIDWVMLLISWISSEYAALMILIGLLVLLWRRNRSIALYSVGVIASSTLWQILLKAVIGRPRPDPVLYPVWQGAGYPSGHVLTSLVIIYILWRLAPYARRRRLSAFLGYAVIIWPLLVGISRIYLNAHYLSDVVGGYLLGVWHLGLAFTILGSGWLKMGRKQGVARVVNGPILEFDSAVPDQFQGAGEVHQKV